MIDILKQMESNYGNEAFELVMDMCQSVCECSPALHGSINSKLSEGLLELFVEYSPSINDAATIEDGCSCETPLSAISKITGISEFELLARHVFNFGDELRHNPSDTTQTCK
jgi:hypothetical protein